MDKCYTITYWMFSRDQNCMVSDITAVFKNREDAFKYVSDALDLELNTIETCYEYGYGAFSGEDITYLIEEHILE